MIYKKDENKGDQKKKKGMAFKSKKVEEKKKGAAFKASSSDDSSASSDDDEDMAMMVKRFKRAFKKGGSKYKKFMKKYTPKTPNPKDSSELFIMSATNQVTSSQSVLL